MIVLGLYAIYVFVMISMLSRSIISHQSSPLLPAAIFDAGALFVVAIGGIYYDIFLNKVTKHKSLLLMIFNYLWIPISPFIIMFHPYLYRMSVFEYFFSALSVGYIFLFRSKITASIIGLINKENGDHVYLNRVKNRADILLVDFFYWSSIGLLAWHGFELSR